MVTDEKVDFVLGCHLEKGASTGDGRADGLFAEDCFDSVLGQLDADWYVGVVWSADYASIWLGGAVQKLIDGAI